MPERTRSIWSQIHQTLPHDACIAADIHCLLKTSDVSPRRQSYGSTRQIVESISHVVVLRRFAGRLRFASLGCAFQPGSILLLSPSVRHMATELVAHGHALVAESSSKSGLALGLDFSREYEKSHRLRGPVFRTAA